MLITVLLLGGKVAASGADKPYKIATISLQQVLISSPSAQAAKKKLETKLAELNQKIQENKGKQDALRAEIEKKGSVWSEDVKQQREREFLKREGEIKILSDDAKREFGDYEKTVMNPILMELHAAIAEIGKKDGYTMIYEYSQKGLESKSGLLYADETLDISSQLSEALEKRLAGKK
jgi:outer membrane protein